MWQASDAGESADLASLIEVEAPAAPLWGPADLRDMLRHRLSIPVPFRVLVRGAVVPERFPTTYGQLLSQARPDERLLSFVAARARQGPDDPDHPLPVEIAAVLYFAAHAAALAHPEGRRLEGCDDRTLSRGFAWVCRQDWIEDSLAALCLEASRRLNVGPEDAELPPALPAPFAVAPTWCEAGLPPNVASEVMRHAGRPQLDDYAVVRRIGEGGMATVWEAVQKSTRRRVALKLLPLGRLGSRTARRRFEREVELAAKLDHAHIARVYDSGIARGIYYYAMELVDGVPIDQFVLSRKPAPAEVLELVRSVCGAVQYAHQRGIIHRDLKPSNILVTADGQPHVVDFGLARDMTIQEDQLTLTLAGCGGTPAFMSPEQAAGNSDAVDTRTDVYSLGATTFLLLAGRPPHDPRGSGYQVLRRIAENELVRAAPAVRPGSDLEAVLLKALATDPADRYDSAAAFADDIGRLSAGEAVVARAASRTYVARKFLRKHCRRLAATAAVLLAVIGTVVYGYLRISDAHRVAEQRLAQLLMSQGQSAAQASLWPRAIALFEESRAALAAIGRPTTPADLELAGAYLNAPPPLNSWTTDGAAVATALSADGNLGASASRNGRVRVWDVILGIPLYDTNIAPEQPRCLAFSPSKPVLAVGASDGTLRLLDYKARAEVARFAHKEAVTCVDYSPDGTKIISGSDDGTACLWDVNSHARIHLMRGASPDSVFHAVRFTPDTACCVLGDGFGQLYLWSTSDGRLIWTQKGYGAVTDLAVSPDGRRCISTSNEIPGTEHPRMSSWDLRQGQGLINFKIVGATRVTYSADGNQCTAAGTDGVIRTFDVQTGEQLRSYWDQRTLFTAVSFHRGNSLAFAAGSDNTLKLMHFWPEGMLVQMRVAHNAPVSAIAVAPQDRMVVIPDRTRLRGNELWTFSQKFSVENHDAQVQVIAVSPDQKWMLSGDAAGRVVLSRAGSGKRVAVLGGHDADVRSVAFTPDSRYGISANGNTITCWDIPARRENWTTRAGATMTWGVGFDPRLNTVSALTVHGQLFTWSVADGTLTRKPVDLKLLVDTGANVVFSDDGSRLFVAVGTGVYLFDTDSGALLRAFPVSQSYAKSLALSHDGRLLACGCQDGSITIWDAETGEQAVRIAGARLSVLSLAFSASGRSLFSGDFGGALREWQLDLPGRVRAVWPRFVEARTKLLQNPHDPSSLAAAAEWYDLQYETGWADQLRASASRK